jgi:hypothetical protein
MTTWSPASREIRLEDGRTTVTDLYSRNGTRLGESQLPGSGGGLTAGVPLTIGPFVSHPTRGRRDGPAIPDASFATTQPTVTTLADKPILVGRADECDIVLADSRVAAPVRDPLAGRPDLVTDLSGRGSTRLGDQPLPEGVAQLWPPEVRLHVGPFSLAQSVDAAPAAAPAKATPAAAVSARATPAPAVSGATTSPTATQSAPSGGMAAVAEATAVVAHYDSHGGACVLLGMGFGLYQMFGPKPAPPTVVPSPSPPIIPPTITPYWTTTPVPSTTPVATSVHTSSSDISSLLETSTPLPTVECTPESAGWLDAFCRDGQNRGSATQSGSAGRQRSASGGRINFFDHLYPLYTRGEESLDGSQATDTMIPLTAPCSLSKIITQARSGLLQAASGMILHLRMAQLTARPGAADGTLLAAAGRRSTYVA